MGSSADEAEALLAAIGNDPRPILVGKLKVAQFEPIYSGERLVAAGWLTGVEGRKYFAGTAIFGEDGDIRALGEATWIDVSGH